ncbi:cucumisin-like [Lotus japonicus]|uniref:cucumisin-like n=1 Tax=Lotus japonicus TaxID=34305 RepID=UPI0025834A99|nr:cucumisin-like [Lotus japonicus]
MACLTYIMVMDYAVVLVLLLTSIVQIHAQEKTYIIYTGASMNDEAASLSIHENMLQQVAADRNAAPKSLTHHYKRSFSGFAAKLTKEEADKVAGLDGVISVFPSTKRPLQTTKSWDFIGFPLNVERTNAERDIIIGLIDTGIWPESESFNDKGLGPPPSKWKGTCQTSSNFTCNKETKISLLIDVLLFLTSGSKIIGARCYGEESLNKEFLSPRDSIGHGTHTASIAAGNPVSGASMLGLAEGTTRGGATSARIAVYKVCWDDGCDDADILSAFDDGIADGVDIFSVSIGASDTDKAGNYLGNSISIGAFHAMRHGILTIASAGNSGPTLGAVDNVHPWSISVAASTIDRNFVTRVKLGDNRIYEGISLNTFDLKGKLYPLIFAGDAPNTKAGINGSKSRFCNHGSLDQNLVKNKIVLCQSAYPNETGPAGFLSTAQTSAPLALAYALPGSYLDLKDAVSIFKYIRSTRDSSATIFKTDELEDISAPEVANFSSRGPNLITPEILKPDLTAPGVTILASWSPIAPVSDSDYDRRELKFNIMSGTSMSCPHVSGAAAYIKSFHPTWSPAAIRSALMTTAKPLSPLNNVEAELAYGAGQISPSKALTPGLVYDATERDYTSFLCGQGYSLMSIQLIMGGNTSFCGTTNESARDLNYPSFSLQVPHSDHTVFARFKRTVTNVGSPMSTYKATVVTAAKGLEIKVTPNVLAFNSLGQTKTFVLTLDGALTEPIVSASLVWDDGTFQVRSPIVVFDVVGFNPSTPASHSTSFSPCLSLLFLSLIFFTHLSLFGCV